MSFRPLCSTTWEFETDPSDPTNSTRFENTCSFNITVDNFDFDFDSGSADDGRQLFRMTVEISFIQSENDLALIDEIFNESDQPLPSRHVVIELEAPDGVSINYSFVADDGDFQGSMTLTPQLKQGPWQIRIEAHGVGIGEQRDSGSVQVGAMFFEER